MNVLLRVYLCVLVRLAVRGEVTGGAGDPPLLGRFIREPGSDCLGREEVV